MIVLDTNVLSEPLRARPDASVLTWLSDLGADAAVTSISVGEILTGVRLLPAGRRRDQLTAGIERVLAAFDRSVLPYDNDAARIYAQLHEQRRADGRALSVEDGMIAAICRSRRATLATRNVKDLEGLGIELVNPWER